MPRRLLSREHVHRVLTRLKCHEVKEYETNTAWETASGVWFTVPHETPERRTSDDTLREIINDVEKWTLFTGTKPPEKGLR